MAPSFLGVTWELCFDRSPCSPLEQTIPVPTAKSNLLAFTLIQTLNPLFISYCWSVYSQCSALHAQNHYNSHFRFGSSFMTMFSRQPLAARPDGLARNSNSAERAWQSFAGSSAGRQREKHLRSRYTGRAASRRPVPANTYLTYLNIVFLLKTDRSF